MVTTGSLGIKLPTLLVVLKYEWARESGNPKSVFLTVLTSDNAEKMNLKTYVSRKLNNSMNSGLVEEKA